MHIRFILIILFLLSIFIPSSLQAQQQSPVLFYGDGCFYCAQVHSYITSANLEAYIEKKEIYNNRDNAQEFNDICDEASIPLMQRGVPLLYTQEGVFIGSDQIISYLSTYTPQQYTPQESIPPQEESTLPPQKEEQETKLTLPILLGGALVDSINPCEFAVLLILMTTILASGNKKRALYSGLAYAASIFISYFLMGIGLYSVIATINTSGVFMTIIGWIAIGIGLFNLKDVFWYGKGFVMEVPFSWRPKLKSLVRSMTGPLSAFLLGFVVSIFLLPCTSGPYVVILGMLGHTETYMSALALLLLYNAIFILPMILLTIAVYFGMNVEKAEQTRERNIRILHLIAGVIMIGMGLVLVTELL